MLLDFLKHNSDCLIICPPFYHSYFAEIKRNDGVFSFAYMSLEEVEELVKNPSKAKECVEGRSIYILHYGCGQKISTLLGEFHNMSISYFPKILVEEIDQSLSQKD